jgi:hypothetical protein
LRTTTVHEYGAGEGERSAGDHTEWPEVKTARDEVKTAEI